MTMNKDAEATSKVDPDDASAEPGAEAPEKAAADDLASEASAAPDAEAAAEDADADAPGELAAVAGDESDPEASDPAPDDEEDARPEALAPEDAAAPDPDAAAGGPFKLHRRARLEETEALLAWLLAAPADAPLEFDASEVDNISTPYVLAIVGAARARAEAGSPAAVRSPSPAFVDAFSDLGLFGDLMKMEIRP